MSELRKNYLQIVDDVLKVHEDIDERLKLVEEKEKQLAKLNVIMEERCKSAKTKITLDVGGKKFSSAKSTLLRFEGTYFHAMLSSDHWQPDEDGSYFIDRNPKYFGLILDYLRTGELNMKNLELHEVEQLEKDFDYFQLKFPSPLDSNVLSFQLQQILIEWLGNQKRTLKLLYQGSRDGYRATNFHQKCENKGATITIIKSSSGHLFGGYTSQSWDSSGNYKSDPLAFIFTLTNPFDIPPTKFPIQQAGNAIHARMEYDDMTAGNIWSRATEFNLSNRYAPYTLRTEKIPKNQYNPDFGPTEDDYCGYAIYGRNDYGPTFGSGIDIYVADNCNQNDNSYFGFPYTYRDTTGKGKNIFTGSSNFQVEEIEIFLVQ